jgi:phage-related protein
MIVYNGIDLTETIPVQIEDITVSPIQLSPVARQRPIRFGADFVRMGGGTRNVTITFALLEIDRDEREKQMQALRDWASLGAEYTLELPQFGNRHLECAVTMHPDYSYRKWFENKLRIQFTCYSNPYWTSNDLLEVPCGTPFSIGGSAPPLMTIERRGTTPLTNATYSNETGSMTFTTIPAGTLTVDLNRQTAAIGGASIMRYYTATSTWIVPQIGANQVINGTGTIKYRERWV